MAFLNVAKVLHDGPRKGESRCAPVLLRERSGRMMPFPALWVILAIVTVSGCMKAATQESHAPSAVSAPPAVRLEGVHDAEIPEMYIKRLRGAVSPTDETVPLTFMAVADHFAAKGEVEKALHFLDRAAGVFVEMRSQSGEATAWCRKFILMLDWGWDHQAQDLLREVQGKWTAPPLRAFAGYAAGHRALLQGDLPRALSHLSRSLEDNGGSPQDPYLLMVRRDAERDIGISLVLEDYMPLTLAIYGGGATVPPMTSDAGGQHLEEALALHQEIRQTRLGEHGDAMRRAEADILSFLGLSAWMQGEREAALRKLGDARNLSRTAGYRTAEFRNLLFLGELGLQGEYGNEGREAAERLRDEADRYRAASYGIWARHILARYAQAEKRNREAIRFLEEAAVLIEERRSRSEAVMLDEICVRQRRATYESLVRMFAAEGMVRESLMAAEKAKALMAVDLLAGEHIGRDPAEREVLTEEVELGEVINGIQRRILQVEDGPATDELRERLMLVEDEYRDLRGRIGAKHGGLLPLVEIRPVEPSSLQGFLDENTTLFDYFVTAEDGLYVWAINRAKIHVEKIDLTRQELRGLVFSFLQAIRGKDKRKIETLSRNAYDVLLKPVIPFVSGDRIGFVPDDALLYLPFAATNYRGRFLAEGFRIFHLPGTGLLEGAVKRVSAAPQDVLAFGKPDLDNEALDLDHGLLEIERIRKRFSGTTAVVGEEATEANAAERAAGYDLLHFAVRGQFVPEDPLDSALLLTPANGRDGRLTAREIFDLRFDARAVVLTGCDPMPEADPEGKGWIAMHRALLRTGSASVVSTLWFVEDRAAVHGLDIFYRQLGKREPVADALQAMQLQMIREGQPPYAWAAFVLTGKY